MTDNCLSCFFSVGVSGSLTCNRDAPSSLATSTPPYTAAWLSVLDTDWCGQFSADDPGVYKPGIPQPPGAQCSTCFYAVGSPGNFLCRWNAPGSYANFPGSAIGEGPGEFHGGWLPVLDTAWCGQYSAIDPSIYQPNVNLFVPQVTSPNPYDNWDIDSNTDLSSIPDVTAQVQVAVNACQNNIGGGIVQLPPGIVRLAGLNITGGGVWLKGYGAATEIDPGAAPATRPKFGTYILHTDTFFPAINVNSSASNVKLSDFGLIEPQPPEEFAFTPIVFPPCIQFDGPNAIDAIVENVIAWRVYQAIRLGSGPGQGVGTASLKDINYATFAPASVGGGIRLFGLGSGSTVNDDVTLSNVRYDPDQLLANLTQQQQWILNNAAALMIDCGIWQARINGCTFRSANVGLGIEQTQSLPSSVFPGIIARECHFNKCSTAILENGAGSLVRIADCSVLGLGASISSYALQSQGLSPLVNVHSIFASNFSDSAINVVATGSGRFNFGSECLINSWNLDGNGNPGVYGSVGNTIYFSTGIQFQNGNGAAVSGGSAAFTGYQYLNLSFSEFGTGTFQVHDTTLQQVSIGNTFFTACDVSYSTALVYLNTQNSHITSLNINGCSSLNTLDCNPSALTGIFNVSGNSVLVNLNFQGNVLSGCNLSSCTSLQFINFQANGSGFTSANITGCISLNNVNFANNGLNQSQVDGILVQLDSNGFGSGAVDVASNTQPSLTGLAAVNDLRNKNWSVVFDPTTMTGSIGGTTLNVTGVSAGYVAPGLILSGAGITPGTTITAFEGGSGGNGTYTVSISQIAGSTTITGA